jgi:hypothetical protein
MTMRRLQLVLPLLVVATATACQPAPPPRHGAPPADWDPELVEAVLRYQIAESGWQLVPLRRNVYLSLFATDPPQSLLDRFADPSLRVYRVSQFKPGDGVVHEIERIRQPDSDHAVVDASWRQSSSTEKAYRYELRRVDGRWKVVQTTAIAR